MLEKKKLALAAGSVTALLSSSVFAQEAAAGSSNQFTVQAAAAVGAGLAIALAALGGALGQGKAAKLAAAGESAQPRLPLRVRAEMSQGLAHEEIVKADDGRRRRAGARQLLDDQGSSHGVQTEPTPRRRNGNSQRAQLTEVRDRLARKALLAIHRSGMGRNLSRGQLAGFIAQGSLSIGQVEIHGPSLPLSAPISAP